MTLFADARQALFREHAREAFEGELLQADALGNGELVKPLPVAARQAYRQGDGFALTAPPRAGQFIGRFNGRGGRALAIVAERRQPCWFRHG